MSSRWSADVSFDSRMTTRAATIAKIPIGTLMKKIQLQSACSASNPPVIGPSASATADTPTQMPIAVPRWRSGNVAVMIDSVAGFIIAAPDTLNRARGDQRLAVRGETAGERRGREDDQSDDEDATAPVEVGELAAGEHEHGERE